MKELGIADVAKVGARLLEAVTDPQVGRLLKAAEKGGFHGFLVAPLEAKQRAARRDLPALPTGARSVPAAAVTTVRALSDQVALVVRNIQYNEELARKNRRAHAPRRAEERFHGHHEPRAAHTPDVDHRL